MITTPEEFISVEEAVSLFGEDFLPEYGVTCVRNNEGVLCGCLAGAIGHRKGGLGIDDARILEEWLEPQGTIPTVEGSVLVYGFDDAMAGSVPSQDYHDSPWYQHGYEIGIQVKEKFGE